MPGSPASLLLNKAPLSDRLVALLLIALLLLPCRLAGQARATSVIRGRVLDEATSTGIAAVQIDFLDGSTRVRGTAVTDSAGNFALPNVPSGAFRLRATRLGYARTLTPYWRIQSSEVLTVNVRMDPQAMSHTPLEITAKYRNRPPVIADFLERARRQNGGTFITRDEIERRQPFRITDLLAGVPGVEVATVPGVGRENRVVRMARTPGRVCPVQVFVDGVFASRIGESPVDDLASPTELEGIEVYRGTSTTPPEFLTADARCGVIALWTRRGSTDLRRLRDH